MCIFQPTFWCGSKVSNSQLMDEGPENMDRTKFERNPHDAKVGISIRHLRKVGIHWFIIHPQTNFDRVIQGSHCWLGVGWFVGIMVQRLYIYSTEEVKPIHMLFFEWQYCLPKQIKREISSTRKYGTNLSDLN